MTEISLGPFVLSVSVLLAFGAILIGVAAGKRAAVPDTVQVERALWLAVAIAVVAARGVFVGRYWQVYASEPWRILDVRDGGLMPVAGIAAALAAASVMAWRRPRLRKGGLVGVLSGSLLWLGATFMLQQLPPAASLPPYTLNDIDGRPLALSALAGKPVVINLWASWCPPCRREMPVLARAQRSTPGVRFVFVNQGESAGAIRSYLASQSLTLNHVLLDPTGKVAKAARAPGLPTTLFFDARGRMRDRRMGELSPATLTHALDSLGASLPQAAASANPTGAAP